MKLHEIKDWSDERLITQNTPDRNGFNAMIVEELYEKLVAKVKNDIYEEVDAICDITVFGIGEIYKYGYAAEDFLGHGDIADWLPGVNETNYNIPISGFNGRITYLLGQFLEVETEVERVQIISDMVIDSYHGLINLGFDPDKCMSEVMKEINSRTGEYSEGTKKWQKYKTPEAMALWYTADFTDCRLQDAA